MIKINLPFVNPSHTYFTNVSPIRLSRKNCHYVFWNYRSIQSNKVNMSVDVGTIICTMEKSCTTQTTIFSINPTCFCYKNILIMNTALCHSSMHVFINVGDIVKINSIAPYILATKEHNSLINIVFTTTFGSVSVGNKH